MRQQNSSKLAIRERRIFSVELKKKAIKLLIAKQSTIKSLMDEHQISANTVYRWLYQYSPNHERRCTLVVQMDSEEIKNADLRHRVAELERIVGQKQLEVDYLNKLLEIGSKELGMDLKKSFSSSPSNGTATIKGPRDTK